MSDDDTHADTIRERCERIFNLDACVRLARSTPEYYDSHGHYLPDVAWLLNETRADLERERARADQAEAALRADKTGSRDSSAADVDGADKSERAAGGHHESVGERQGRQPVLPVRLVIDGNGYVWRDFGEEGVLSMAPSNPDNEPVPEPLAYYVRAALPAGSDRREPTP